MLRVSCWTGTAPARSRAPHSGSPTRITKPSPRPDRVSAGPHLGQRRVGRLRLLERGAVDRGERDAHALVRLGLLEHA